MQYISTIVFCLISIFTFAQSSTISGTLMDVTGEPVIYANVVLYDQTSDKLVKVETTDLEGAFIFTGIPPLTYKLVATYVGQKDIIISDIDTANEPNQELGVIQFKSTGVELETAVVTAQRALVEIKPDRTVFNVQGTINSAGDNALQLLRKAPGVLVDNNDNISVLSRSGVLIYVDGKRLPLSGDDLSNYLQSLPAEQIDKIDIITNPGAKYEAEGNAGIIDIRMKKDKNLGSNGTLSGSYGQGRETRYNVNATGNYRNKRLNSFGTLGYNQNDFWNEMAFSNFQNTLFMEETNTQITQRNTSNYRWGTDFFISSNSTLGFLISGNTTTGSSLSDNRIEIATIANPSLIDSILVAENNDDIESDKRSYNLNYAYRLNERSLNIDLDYGQFRMKQFFNQPNKYFDANEVELLTFINTAYDTPTDIDIYTAKVDYEQGLLGGKLGFGTKFSKVATDNTFEFFDIINDERILSDTRSNRFEYDENVYAGYVSYVRPLGAAWSFAGGLRVEATAAKGVLTAYDENLQEDPVDLNYTNFFPNLGFTYTLTPMHVFALNYGRRINRPDYNVLNPFRVQLSELSFSKGNESLSPEIVNNVELGYTWQYRYNFKLSYSKTLDQITRLIGPDDVDPRASFIGWDNLAEQTIYALNISAPIDIKPWWNAYFNAGASYINNQADYGEGAIVDVQAFSYNVYQQHTFTMPKGWKGEVSGWYSGPGVWGGVFEYETSWSLNLGLQRKFFSDRMNVRLSVQDIFFQSGWEGFSEFDGLRSEGMGNFDSRRASISLSYNFGNNNVKSRKRKTGIEDEASRVTG